MWRFAADLWNVTTLLSLYTPRADADVPSWNGCCFGIYSGSYWEVMGRNLAEGFPQLTFPLAECFEPTRSGTRDVTYPPAFHLCITETRKRDYFKVSGTWMNGISIIRYERARLISRAASQIHWQPPRGSPRSSEQHDIYFKVH